MFKKEETKKQATEVAEEKAVIGTVDQIRGIVAELQKENPKITPQECKKIILEKYPELNKHTVSTQVHRIFSSQDENATFKATLKGLVKDGNITKEDTTKIEMLIDLYKSSMTVEDVVAFLDAKPAKSIKIKDLAEYSIVPEEEALPSDITIQFANKTIYVRK